jgi:hypothetical protein
MDKSTILNNIESISAENLFEYISNGKVTLEELRETGNLDASKRKAISKLQNELYEQDDHAWEISRYGNETSLTDYITRYPNGRHLVEAKQRIDFLTEQRKSLLAQKKGILDKIRINPNTYNPQEILSYLQNGTITEGDLEDCGIPQSAIFNLDKVRIPPLDMGPTPDNIPPGYTEVYFWGSPGSGKTCALGAILQMAEKDGLLNIASGSGFHYANQLKNIFSDDDVANDYLPAPSPFDNTQYLPFTLKRENERHSRSISLIELSGEIFKCFYYKNAGRPMPSQLHLDTFNSLNSFLNGSNRKVHFFFIDYDKENKPDIRDGVKQSDYLAAAATYFKDNEVFGKTTDAIYVVLTKSDLMIDESGDKVPMEKRVEYAKKHFNNHNFSAFINTLKGFCKKYSINGGKLTVEPFSLGQVYFQQICNFEGSAATKLIKILMDRIPVNRRSLLDVFNK